MSDLSRIRSTSPQQPTAPISARCPVCSHRATFDRLENVNDASLTITDTANRAHTFLAGQRLCPNADCRAHIFFIKDQSGGIMTYPAERLDFDTTNLPARVQTAIEEAVTCHAASAYVGAAMLVRKTLEQVCEDRGATGATLKDRIKALSSMALLPNELFVAMDELRILGNDAAHVESKTYDSVGKAEVEAGVELAKEILKAVYQYSALLDKLKALKKPTP